ncbi:hypothetical protein Pcinc_007148 [Petrolisthes cinctipes]|uniref:Uncharacterized protein n=1 Tax=Petrolisthes cinctipes TaxID=88211 RepID=A0AAE1KXP0_PETCI|nr:hypothetical protein Pcinc_007148 [Petrolisthes cinctipes]
MVSFTRTRSSRELNKRVRGDYREFRFTYGVQPTPTGSLGPIRSVSPPLHHPHTSNYVREKSECVLERSGDTTTLAPPPPGLLTV